MLLHEFLPKLRGRVSHCENVEISGKVRKFDIGQGKSWTLRKVTEIVICLWCTTAVAIVTK